MDKVHTHNRILIALAGNSAPATPSNSWQASWWLSFRTLPPVRLKNSFFCAGRALCGAALEHGRCCPADLLRCLFYNMTRLASTTADVVANDDALVACFTHRAASLWRALLVDDYDNETDSSGGHLLGAIFEFDSVRG